MCVKGKGLSFVSFVVGCLFVVVYLLLLLLAVDFKSLNQPSSLGLQKQKHPRAISISATLRYALRSTHYSLFHNTPCN